MRIGKSTMTLTRSQSGAVAQRAVNAALAVALNQLQDGDFSKYGLVLDKFAIDVANIDAWNAFKAKHPGPLAVLQCYARRRRSLEMSRLPDRIPTMVAAELLPDDARDHVLDNPSDVLYASLSFQVLFTREPGLAWYVHAFRDDVHFLMAALQAARLLTSDLEYGWILQTFGRNATLLVAALKAAGKITPEPGRDWYISAITRDNIQSMQKTRALQLMRYQTLEEAGLLTADAGVEWYVDALFTDCVFSDKWTPKEGPNEHEQQTLIPALRKAGLLEGLGLDWFRATFEEPADLLASLIEAGMLRPQQLEWVIESFRGPGAERYLALALTHASMRPTHRALRLRGHDWLRDTFGTDRQALFHVLKSINFLVPFPGVEWYIDTFTDRRMLLRILVGTRFLCDGTCRDWIASVFRGHDSSLLMALAMSSNLNDEVPREWYEEAFEAGSAALDMALYRAGV